MKTKLIIAFFLTLLIGCAGNATYKTLYSVGHAVDGSVKGYLDLVVAHKVPTNDVPKVMKFYGKYQAVYRQAVDYAQLNLKSPPDTNLIASASEMLAVVAAAKGTK